MLKLISIFFIVLILVILVSGCSTAPHQYQDCRLDYFERELNAHHTLENVINDSAIACKKYFNE